MTETETETETETDRDRRPLLKHQSAHACHRSCVFILGTNGCSSMNGDCSNLCLAHPLGHQCACPDGILLKPADSQTCEGGLYSVLGKQINLLTCSIVELTMSILDYCTCKYTHALYTCPHLVLHFCSVQLTSRNPFHTFVTAFQR